MKHISFFLLIIASINNPIFAFDNADYNEINHIVEHFTNSWNFNAGKGFADHYSEDADFVNIFGMAFTGKQEIETRHVRIHESFLKGSIFEVTDVRFREAKPDVVIAQVSWKVTNIPKIDVTTKETITGIFTHVFLKENDKWEITASQNTLSSKL